MADLFDQLRGEWHDKAFAWDLAQRPVPERPSDARVLDPDVMLVVPTSEPGLFRQVAKDWEDRGTVEDLKEAVHRLELERAAVPPVIEVTVTTPPGGIPRADLDRLVRDKLADLAAPVTGPAQLPGRPRQVLAVSPRRQPDVSDVLPVSEDDTPTQELPVTRDDGEGWAHVEHVILP